MLALLCEVCPKSQSQRGGLATLSGCMPVREASACEAPTFRGLVTYFLQEEEGSVVLTAQELSGRLLVSIFLG